MLALLLAQVTLTVTEAGGKIEVVRDDGGRRVAVVREPAAADADLVVWVTPLRREEAFARLKEAKGVHLAICSGRGTADPEPLPAGEAWLVAAPGSAGLVGRIEVTLGRPLGLRSTLAAAPAPKGSPLAESARPGAEKAPERPEGRSRAVRIAVRGSAERNAYAGWSGRARVLDLEFENLIPLALVRENRVPVQVKVPKLADHLYLVIDGRRLSRLRPEAADWPGHLPKELLLDRQGARLRGNALFEAPAEAAALELRFYDFAHGHVRIPLAGAAAEEAPIVPAGRNEAVELGVFGLRREGGRLRVDLRARSAIELDADATAFVPGARPGERLKVGTVADWTDARAHLQLVVDGELALAPADFPETLRFLPDLFTGAEAVFAAPEKAASLELRCDFPNARYPDGRVIRPSGITLLLEGTPPAPKAAEPLARIDDGVFQVEVVGQSLEKGRLTLDVVVRNTGTSLEVFQTDKQLKYATEKGALLPLDPSTFAGPRAPLPLLGVPPGGRRAFQAVFSIPAADRRPRLSYAGVTKAATVDLRPLEPAKAACPSCKAEAAPSDRFCAGCGTKLR